MDDEKNNEQFQKCKDTSSLLESLKMSRRHSVVDAYTTVETKIRETMSELSKLWDEVDMSDAMRLKRVDNAFKLIIQSCDEMIDGEKEMVKSVKCSVRDEMIRVAQMRSELEMEPFERPPDIAEKSIALMKHLQAEVKSLENEYTKRHEDQKVLVEKLFILKKRLESDFEFECETHLLFPVLTTKRFEEECAQMEELLRDRYSKIEQLQSDMKQWRRLSNNVSEYIKGDDMLKELLDRNVDSDEFVFSNNVLDLYETYHSEMKPLYDRWLEEIEFRWLEKHQELSDLWDKCLVPHERRFFESRFEPGRHTEDALLRMTDECEKLSKKYEACKVIFGLVERWKQVWNEKLGIEEKRKMPDYYKKVNVLPDNKRERELVAMMPTLEKDIRIATKKYEEKNDGDSVLIQDMSPSDYINFIKEEHKRELKFELQLKKEEKTRLNSPQPSPRSQKRTNPYFRTPKTPAPAAKRLHMDPVLPPCMSPVTSEAISFITPTRRPQGGPLTSSPKETTPSRATTAMSKRAITPSSVATSSKRPLSRKNM